MKGVWVWRLNEYLPWKSQIRAKLSITNSESSKTESTQTQCTQLQHHCLGLQQFITVLDCNSCCWPWKLWSWAQTQTWGSEGTVNLGCFKLKHSTWSLKATWLRSKHPHDAWNQCGVVLVVWWWWCDRGRFLPIERYPNWFIYGPEKGWKNESLKKTGKMWKKCGKNERNMGETWGK